MLCVPFCLWCSGCPCQGALASPASVLHAPAPLWRGRGFRASAVQATYRLVIPCGARVPVRSRAVACSVVPPPTLYQISPIRPVLSGDALRVASGAVWLWVRLGLESRSAFGSFCGSCCLSPPRCCEFSGPVSRPHFSAVPSPFSWATARLPVPANGASWWFPPRFPALPSCYSLLARAGGPSPSARGQRYAYLMVLI